MSERLTAIRQEAARMFSNIPELKKWLQFRGYNPSLRWYNVVICCHQCKYPCKVDTPQSWLLNGYRMKDGADTFNLLIPHYSKMRDLSGENMLEYVDDLHEVTVCGGDAVGIPQDDYIIKGNEKAKIAKDLYAKYGGRSKDDIRHIVAAAVKQVTMNLPKYKAIEYLIQKDGISVVMVCSMYAILSMFEMDDDYDIDFIRAWSKSLDIRENASYILKNLVMDSIEKVVYTIYVDITNSLCKELDSGEQAIAKSEAVEDITRAAIAHDIKTKCK